MRIGIFDSGKGGEIVAARLAQAFSGANLRVVNDRPHMPYGNKTPEQVRALTAHAIQPLLDANCDVIVIACNTATAHAIDLLRRKYPAQIFIGFEPMVKPASRLTRSGVVAVCATPATLASRRYRQLVKDIEPSIKIIEPDCSRWAEMIECGEVDMRAVRETVRLAVEQGADVIVLGCTHYHMLRDEIQRVSGSGVIICEPTAKVIERLRNM
jgi:glutamate racemase